MDLMVKALAEMTDNELIELSKTNPDVFGELVLRYQNRLFRYVKRIFYFSEEDIEDILQETFIKTYKSLNIFDSDLKFSTWIYQIARNTTIDAIRKKKSQPQAICLEDNDVVRFFRSNIDVQVHVETKDNLSKMKEIINKLPYNYKEVMVLRFLEEKTYEEIMDIIKKPKGTVAAIISRGRKMLLEEARKNFGISII